VWTHSLFFTFSELKISKFENVNTLIEGSTDFSSQTHFLQLVWICSNKIYSKINMFHTHLSSEYCELDSIESDLLRAVQQHQEHPQIPIQFLVLILILFSFHWENGSIINSFHTVAPTSLKTELVHPYSLRVLWKYQERRMKCHGLGDLSMINKGWKNDVNWNISPCENIIFKKFL